MTVLSFQFTMGPKTKLDDTFSTLALEEEEKEKNRNLITAITLNKGTN